MVIKQALISLLSEILLNQKDAVKAMNTTQQTITRQNKMSQIEPLF